MKSFSKYSKRGLPGGPNEIIEYMTGAISTDGFKFDSEDVDNDFNIIPSGDITMENVEFPVFGIDNLGNSQMMFPEENYEFPGDMVFELPMAQGGGGFYGELFDALEPQDPNRVFQNSDAKDFILDYINSPKYLERLQSSGYDSPEDERDLRASQVEGTGYMVQRGKPGLFEQLIKTLKGEPYSTTGSSYYAQPNLVIYDPEQAEEYDIPKSSVLAHEYGHAELQNFTDLLHQSPFRLNDSDVNELVSRLQTYEGQTDHDLEPDENKSDLNALRFELFQQGLYDAGTQDIDKETLRKADSSFIKDRLLRNYSEDDLIWLLNNIAMDDSQEAGLPMAKKGLEKYQTLGAFGEVLQDKVLTMANAPEFFNNQAVYYRDDSVPVETEQRYNDMIREKVYAGTHGYNPATKQLVVLDNKTSPFTDNVIPAVDVDPLDQLYNTLDRDEMPGSVSSGIASKDREAYMDTLPADQKEALEDEYKDMRKGFVTSSNQAAFENPIMYAPGLFGLSAIGGTLAAGAGSGLSSAISAPLTIGSYVNPYITAGNLLNAGFATDFLVNRAPKIPGLIQEENYGQAAFQGGLGLLDLMGAGIIKPGQLTSRFVTAADDIVDAVPTTTGTGFPGYNQTYNKADFKGTLDDLFQFKSSSPQNPRVQVNTGTTTGIGEAQENYFRSQGIRPSNTMLGAEDLTMYQQTDAFKDINAALGRYVETGEITPELAGIISRNRNYSLKGIGGRPTGNLTTQRIGNDEWTLVSRGDEVVPSLMSDLKPGDKIIDLKPTSVSDINAPGFRVLGSNYQGPVTQITNVPAGSSVYYPSMQANEGMYRMKDIGDSEVLLPVGSVRKYKGRDPEGNLLFDLEGDYRTVDFKVGGDKSLPMDDSMLSTESGKTLLKDDRYRDVRKKLGGSVMKRLAKILDEN